MAFSLSAISLVAQDAGSGVASCVVTGTVNLQVVQILYARFSPTAGAMAWIPGPMQTASGSTTTVSVTPAVGPDDTGSGTVYYQWVAVVLDGSGDILDVSNIYYRPLVDVLVTSVWERCVSSVITLIQSLNLDGLTSDKIVKVWYPGAYRNIEPTPPCIQVAPMGAETYPGQLTGTDDVGYGVLVVLFAPTNRESQGKLSQVLLWRQKIQHAFRFQRLAGTPEIFWTECYPDVVANPGAFQDNLLASALMFRFLSRETRGVN